MDESPCLVAGPSLETGLCCHESVPLRERLVALLCTWEGMASRSGEGNGRDEGICTSRSFVGDILPLTAFDRESGLIDGLNSTGGFKAWSCWEELRGVEVFCAGPVLEGDKDRARSTLTISYHGQ